VDLTLADPRELTGVAEGLGDVVKRRFGRVAGIELL
jgi:hypothetical protein